MSSSQRSSSGARPVHSDVALSRLVIIIIIKFLFITLTCNAETWNGVIKSNSQIYCPAWVER